METKLLSRKRSLRFYRELLNILKKNRKILERLVADKEKLTSREDLITLAFNYHNSIQGLIKTYLIVGTELSNLEDLDSLIMMKRLLDKGTNLTNHLQQITVRGDLGYFSLRILLKKTKTLVESFNNEYILPTIGMEAALAEAIVKGKEK
jgi:hypothetical protein